MSNNDENITAKAQHFDLRERRLKLVYKILYVVVAIWIAVLLSVAQNALEKSEIPVYSFVLSVASVVIIQIFKYAIMEFRCLKIVGQLSDELIKQTELRYENIWKYFSLILAFCGLALILHFNFVEKISDQTFLYIFLGCIVYFCIKPLAKRFTRKFENIAIKILDIGDIIIGSIVAYSLCAATFLIVSST